MLDIQEIATRH